MNLTVWIFGKFETKNDEFCRKGCLMILPHLPDVRSRREYKYRRPWMVESVWIRTATKQHHQEDQTLDHYGHLRIRTMRPFTRTTPKRPGRWDDYPPPSPEDRPRYNTRSRGTQTAMARRDGNLDRVRRLYENLQGEVKGLNTLITSRTVEAKRAKANFNKMDNLAHRLAARSAFQDAQAAEIMKELFNTKRDLKELEEDFQDLRDRGLAKIAQQRRVRKSIDDLKESFVWADNWKGDRDELDKMFSELDELI